MWWQINCFTVLKQSCQGHITTRQSVIKDIMTSCDIPRPQEVPLLVNSHVTRQPPFLGRNLAEGVYRQALDYSSFSVWHVIVFPVKLWPLRMNILESYELFVSWCFIVLLCCVMMFHCVTSTCVFLVFCPSRHQTVTQWKWPLFSFCSSPQFSAGRWVIFHVKSKLLNIFFQPQDSRSVLRSHSILT